MAAGRQGNYERTEDLTPQELEELKRVTQDPVADKSSSSEGTDTPQ